MVLHGHLRMCLTRPNLVIAQTTPMWKRLLSLLFSSLSFHNFILFLLSRDMRNTKGFCFWESHECGSSANPISLVVLNQVFLVSNSWKLFVVCKDFTATKSHHHESGSIMMLICQQKTFFMLHVADFFGC